VSAPVRPLRSLGRGRWVLGSAQPIAGQAPPEAQP
jgi:hypothetical protein